MKRFLVAAGKRFFYAFQTFRYSYKRFADYVLTIHTPTPFHTVSCAARSFPTA